MHRLSGSDRFIADYLSEEVLGGQEPELRDFIVDMSVFDRFNAALANEAAQISSAAGLLHRLERDNAFLVPLPEAGWYRFHHLFAAYAQATLEMEYPERVVDLHRRGARWLAFHDHPEDAIGHLLAAGDTDEAAHADPAALGPLRRRRPIRDRDGMAASAARHARRPRCGGDGHRGVDGGADR